MRSVTVIAAGVLLVASATAETSAMSCESLIGTQPDNFAEEVKRFQGGCAATYCPSDWSGKQDRTYTDAQNYCGAAGMRVCTLAELQNGWGAGTGCDFDLREVWTSDECASSSPSMVIYTTYIHSTKETRCRWGIHTGTNGLQAIRCCADSEQSVGEMSGQVDAESGADWVLAAVGNDVYKCSGDKCFVSSIGSRHSFSTTTAPEGAEFSPAATFSATTDDGTWSSDLSKVTFISQSKRHRWPFSCECQA